VTALAALVQALVMVALAVMTALYVRLTNRIAAATQRQADVVTIEREERLDNRRAALHALAGQLRATLRELPGQPPSGEHVVGVTLWPDDTLVELVELTTELPGVDSRVAQQAIAAMRWIGERVAGLKTGPDDAGGLSDEQSRRMWPDQLATARRALEAIEQQAHPRVARGPARSSP
jgi:hypothetical protein